MQNTEKKRTLLQRFEYFTRRHRKDIDIINFLNDINDEYLRKGNNLTDEEALEILDFGTYFGEKYYASLQNAFMREWVDDPYIFKLYVKIQSNGFSSDQNSSKRKKEKKKIEKKDTNEGLLQRFREYMQGHNEKKEVIKFVNLINWEYLQKKGHLTKKEEEEIIVFARYFMKNLYPLLEEDFIKEWGDVPYIVQLSAELEAMRIMDIR